MALTTYTAGEVLTAASLNDNFTFAAAGKVVQVVNTQIGTAATGTTTIPFDNTIPQSNEGSEILSTTFTPTSTSNKLEIEFDGLLMGAEPGLAMVLALFEDGTCVGARWFEQSSGGATSSRIGFQITPSSTSSTTYSLRFGTSSGVGNVYVNRQANAQYTLGGLQEYSMTIQEVKASA